MLEINWELNQGGNRLKSYDAMDWKRRLQQLHIIIQ